MKIDRVDIIVVELPLIRPFVTSSSSRTHLRHILIKAHADGIVGWGESASPIDPYYCPETTETCWHILKDFIVPVVVDREWQTIEQFVASYRRVKGNNFAKAGMEMAAWDLLSQAHGVPLHRALGGTRGEILSGVSLGIENDTAKLMSLIERYLEEGYRRIKLKIAPGHDVDVIAIVRRRFPDVPLMADANSAYTLDDVDKLRELDQFNLLMIEQPLAHDDIVDHAKLQRELKTPVCLDESIHSVEDARKALDLGSAGVINIKVSRLGGLLEAKRVHDLCRARGVPVWCGGMHEFGVGRAANVAISTLPGFTIPGDVSGSDKYYRRDIVEPPILAVGGAIQVPNRTGLGYHPQQDLIDDRTIRSLSITTGAKVAT